MKDSMNSNGIEENQASKLNQASQVFEEVDNDENKKTENYNEIKYGKFKSLDALVDGYNCLESEFTKRAQKLSELEKEKATAVAEQNEQTKWGSQLGQLEKKYPFSKDMLGDIVEAVEHNNGLLEHDNCLEMALLNVLSNRYQDSVNKLQQRDLVALTANIGATNTQERDNINIDAKKDNILGSDAFKNSDTSCPHKNSEKGYEQKSENNLADKKLTSVEVKGMPMKILTSGGEAPISLPLKPRSLTDAGKIAIKILNDK